MQLIKPSFKIYIPGYKMYENYVLKKEIYHPGPEGLEDLVLQHYFREQSRTIEWAARTAYKSEERITANSYKTFVKSLVRRNHTACLEFADMIVKFTCSRYMTHELVRHRIPSYVQESTRFVAYDLETHGESVIVVPPEELVNSPEALEDFVQMVLKQEELYMKYRSQGMPPQTARAYLPSELKTEICVKANWREWRHIFDLRVLGGSGVPAPEMYRLLYPLYEKVKQHAPEAFE